MRLYNINATKISLNIFGKDKCLLIAILICSFATTTLSSCSNDKNVSKEKSAIPVTVMKAEYRAVPIITELPGRIRALKKAEVRPQVNGIIQQQLFIEGSIVKKGDSLYQIDPAPFKATYSSAKGNLEKSRAKISSLKHKFERYGKLRKKNAVSEQEFEDAKSEYKQAIADVIICEAAVQIAKINLDYTKVLSPISGRIGKSYVTAGSLVTNNQVNPLATIQQTDFVYVDVTRSVSQMFILKERIEKGQLIKNGEESAKVSLKLENGDIYQETGLLSFTDITVDEDTDMVVIRAIFPNKDYKLLPGMYVKLLVNEGINSKAMPIPQLAVQRDPKGQASVFIVTQDAKSKQVNVTVDDRKGN